MHSILYKVKVITIQTDISKYFKAWACVFVTNPIYQMQPRECTNVTYKNQHLVIELVLTVSGLGSKILWIKDFAATGNQDVHENSTFSIYKEKKNWTDEILTYFMKSE